MFTIIMYSKNVVYIITRIFKTFHLINMILVWFVISSNVLLHVQLLIRFFFSVQKYCYFIYFSRKHMLWNSLEAPL